MFTEDLDKLELSARWGIAAVGGGSDLDAGGDEDGFEFLAVYGAGTGTAMVFGVVDDGATTVALLEDNGGREDLSGGGGGFCAIENS